MVPPLALDEIESVLAKLSEASCLFSASVAELGVLLPPESTEFNRPDEDATVPPALGKLPPEDNVVLLPEVIDGDPEPWGRKVVAVNEL